MVLAILSLFVQAPQIEMVSIAGSNGISPFQIGKYEVTQRQYAAFIADTGYDGSDHPSSKRTEPFLNDWKGGKPNPERLNYPVCNVNLHHAKAFCVWLAKRTGKAYRLPTDAEWTLAASGKEGRLYPWGNTWQSNRCNWGSTDDGFSEASPVGAFPRGATPEGAYDMAGNIWEWTTEGHLRGGPWCMGKDRLLANDVADEDDDRCDDKFGFRVCLSSP